ncbi:hypothetical protein E2562_019900 [Oryza meyeriana var. granulata]|uniref:Uncharacterized protein n=1 Tax=Oryza meyeriana var. granulata TaxID=110450 RepID=A0A6G1EXF3_9ORYZ|nr:hypothetical protein E2562_019900 [Oryza meyeriana var. granulata]
MEAASMQARKFGPKEKKDSHINNPQPWPRAILPMQHDDEASGSPSPRWNESWSDEDFDQEKDALIPDYALF